MEYHKLMRYVENPDLLSNPMVLKELEAAIHTHPYFQTLHTVYLKALRLQGRFNYTLQLRVSSLYSKNREHLFYYIREDLASSGNRPTKTVQKDDIETQKKPASAIPSETRSMAKGHDVSRNTDGEDSNLNSASIERFIARSDDYKKPLSSEGFKSNPSEKRLNIDKSLYTETLADLFMDQQKYDQALEAYEYLILKKPEKRELFEKKIDTLKKLL